MNTVKKKIVLASGIFWCGVSVAVAILSYGTHAGPRHPNPSMVVIMFPLMTAGLAGAFRLAANRMFVAMQLLCGVILAGVVLAMDQQSIGPDWPPSTSALTAALAGVVSIVATSLMNIGTSDPETHTGGWHARTA